MRPELIETTPIKDSGLFVTEHHKKGNSRLGIEQKHEEILDVAPAILNEYYLQF